MVVDEIYVERIKIRNGDEWKWREPIVRMEGNTRARCSCIQMGLTHVARGIFGSFIIYLCGLMVKRVDQTT